MLYCEYFGWFFIVGVSNISYFVRKKNNKTDKFVFINETEFKPKGRIVSGRCPAHNALCTYIDIENFQERSERLLLSDFFENIWDMGNCCFRGSSNKIKIEDNVVGGDRLIPEDAITLFYSEEFDCFMLTFELRNFETYSFRSWPQGQRSPYVSDDSEYSSAADDSGIDFSDF